MPGTIPAKTGSLKASPVKIGGVKSLTLGADTSAGGAGGGGTKNDDPANCGAVIDASPGMTGSAGGTGGMKLLNAEPVKIGSAHGNIGATGGGSRLTVTSSKSRDDASVSSTIGAISTGGDGGRYSNSTISSEGITKLPSH